jgi:hypothetical protein
MDVIASVQNAIEIVGKLRALSKKIEDAEFKMLLADLSSDLADTKIEIAELKTQLAKQLEENIQLRKLLEQRVAAKPTISDGAYRFEDEEGLFCTACYDTKGLKVRVAPLSPSFRAFGKWKCPACGAKLG